MRRGSEEIERRCLQMTKLYFVQPDILFHHNDFNFVVIDIYKLGWQLRHHHGYYCRPNNNEDSKFSSNDIVDG